MLCPKCNEQHDIYSAVIGLWLCPKCKVPLNDSDADTPPATVRGISADKVLIDDVEQTLEDKSTTRDKIKQAVIDVIGKDRPFMDVPDIAEGVTQNVMGIIAQNSTYKEVAVSVHGGVAYVDRVPPGVIVRLRDYDVEGCPEDDLHRDKDGNFYLEGVYGFDPGYPG